MNGNVGYRKSIIVLALLAVLCWPVVSGGAAFGAEAVADKIDVETYVNMSRLRETVGLGAETLAAIGCSESQATIALDGLLTWYGSNKTAIAANRQANAQAVKALRAALRKISLGPKNQSLIAGVPALKAAVAATLKQRSDLVKAAIEAVEAKLPAAQKSVWATARKNMALRSKYRYATSLTAAQAKALHVANRAYARRLASAKGSSARASVTQKFKTAEADILNESQKTAIAAARTNASAKLADAVKASKTVMPMPAALVEAMAADAINPATLQIDGANATEK
jgi:hypothetical protein